MASKALPSREIVADLRLSPRYSRILNAMRDQFTTQGEPDALVVPYILLCATALQARLNDELFSHAERMWGENFKQVADSYLSMNFRGKLNSIVPILTDGAYRIVETHEVYRALASLISVRNRLVHPKPVSKRYSDGETFPGPMGEHLASKTMSDELSDLTIGSTQQFTPFQYHQSLERLDRWFFRRYPDRLSKVALVEKRESP